MGGFAGAAAGVLLFAIVATLNSGGYRYGASDQAFYIPAILETLHPELFPRDRALIEPQARYFFVDEIVAGGMRLVGGSIETWFAAGYLLTLAVLALSLGALGRTVFASPLAVTALVAVYTLKHRIARTGVNTLEGYFHPRVLVFAAGVAAIVLYLRGRRWLALALVALAGLLHPTTAAFFVLLLGVATWVTPNPSAHVSGSSRRHGDPTRTPRASDVRAERAPLAPSFHASSERGTRPALTVIGLTGALAGVWLVTAGPWRDALVPMDAEWRALLSTKDYLFPIEVWPASAWLINLGTAAIAIGGLTARRRAGVAHRGERGLLVGAVLLLLLFLVTLPLVHYGVALAVQLQLSRVFWLLELLALIPVVWWLVDRPAAKGASGHRIAIAVTAVLVAIGAARGMYVAFVEREPAVFQGSLPRSDWSDAMRWIEMETPTDAHILADPGHAFLYGYPVRFVGRDVYLETVKDSAMALYNRPAAGRVIARLRDVGDFATLTADQARRLASTYDLDYLVTVQTMELPERAAFGRFHIYALR